MTVGAIAGVVVGLVFVVSGVAKLADRRWRDREVALGTPAWVLPLLPYVEIVIGALVAVRIQRIVIGAAAAILVFVLTLFLMVKWEERRGEPCNCMGMLSTRPASARTIVRNAVLLALSLVAALVG